MSLKLNGTLVLLGCGKMGGAMLEGWLKGGADPAHIVALDPRPAPEVVEWLAKQKVRLNPPIADIKDAQVLVIAVKPQMMSEALPPLAPLAKSKPLVLSVAAGKTIATFEAAFGADASVIRTIPNTPAAIGRGITAMVGNAHVSPAQMQLAEALLSSTGEVVKVDNEEAIDFVTAVSGSGPAYVFLLAEVLASAGEKLGLSKELSTQLARATVSGAGELMRQSGTDAAVLRQNVTSPNGTTYAALQVLMADDSGMKPLMEKAVAAAAARSKELAK
ncbi:pyrroline-5-carboxylate reductase [Aestuariivirga litoralis]|uniref:pyrroline-5-carboxylate reductase n=1 Tax=Aestuariivirga litoralis TaxID=2650924 RepID=UPI0018C681AD|nr:pyrroline-5-carboxylate reductase [Aestuariivirga litoralis]MBG1230971.1 pyrroline-5-carboxylate reductase [Aestuariivirga litoralis]